MRVGFIGTQSGMTNFQKEEVRNMLAFLKATEFCHGDSLGSDSESNKIAMEYGIKNFTIFPPSESRKRAYCFLLPEMTYNWHTIINASTGIINVRWMPVDTYLNRSKHIIDNTDYIIACPKEHQHNIKSATWSAIRYAWKIKKNITIIPPIKREEENDDKKNV